MCPTSNTPPPHDPVGRLRSIGIADSLGGRLVLTREVGAGGMGRVYQATDEATGRALAVKLIQDVGGDAALERFTAEAEILEGLDHPAIVAHVGHGTTPDGHPYLAMAWIEGEDLGRRLSRGRLAVTDVVVLGRRVASGLAAAHRAGVVHRDLKPSNIVLAGGSLSEATLIDFGIARRAGGEPLTRTGELIGTPGYMAPEQVRGRRVDGRADLFALGCVLYQCLVGRAPFEGDELMTVLARVLLEDAPRVRVLRRDVPRSLERLIARLLAKDEALRPATADEVDEALAALVLDEDDAGEYDDTADAPDPEAPTLPGGDAATAVAPSRKRRRWPVPAAVALGGVVATGWILTRAQPATAPAPIEPELGPADDVPADEVAPRGSASMSFTVMRDGDIIAMEQPAVPDGLRTGDRVRLRSQAAPGTWLRIEAREQEQPVRYFEGAVPADRWLPFGVTLTPGGDARLHVLACADEPRDGAFEAMVHVGACQQRTFDLL